MLSLFDAGLILTGFVFGIIFSYILNFRVLGKDDKHQTHPTAKGNAAGD